MLKTGDKNKEEKNKEENILDKIKTHSTIIISGSNANIFESIFNELASEIKNKTTEYVILEKTDESKNLLTEDVETVQSFVKSKNTSPRYIITNKSIRNTVLQNKLLKILEETKENIFIIIVQESTVYLLPTVISRCQVIEMSNSVENLTSVDKKKSLLIKNKKYTELLKLLEIENASMHGTITAANMSDYVSI